ncbi:MAG: hypothetical protein M0C28_39920 [Candidatus Moduliflexus flocculans]|nr:hypothetical protein [Candidatus Moduliflexus flocculans]
MTGAQAQGERLGRRRSDLAATMMPIAWREGPGAVQFDGSPAPSLSREERYSTLPRNVHGQRLGLSGILSLVPMSGSWTFGRTTRRGWSSA